MNVQPIRHDIWIIIRGTSCRQFSYQQNPIENYLVGIETSFSGWMKAQYKSSSSIHIVVLQYILDMDLESN